jgi:hypothetical protein
VNRGAGERTLWANGQVIGRVVGPETRGNRRFLRRHDIARRGFQGRPGCSVAAPLFVGTESFRGDLGHTVPPGR